MNSSWSVLLVTVDQNVLAFSSVVFCMTFEPDSELESIAVNPTMRSGGAPGVPLRLLTASGAVRFRRGRAHLDDAGVQTIEAEPHAPEDGDLGVRRVGSRCRRLDVGVETREKYEWSDGVSIGFADVPLLRESLYERVTRFPPREDDRLGGVVVRNRARHFPGGLLGGEKPLGDGAARCHERDVEIGRVPGPALIPDDEPVRLGGVSDAGSLLVLVTRVDGELSPEARAVGGDEPAEEVGLSGEISDVGDEELSGDRAVDEGVAESVGRGDVAARDERRGIGAVSTDDSVADVAAGLGPRDDVAVAVGAVGEMGLFSVAERKLAAEGVAVGVEVSGADGIRTAVPPDVEELVALGIVGESHGGHAGVGGDQDLVAENPVGAHVSDDGPAIGVPQQIVVPERVVLDDHIGLTTERVNEGPGEELGGLDPVGPDESQPGDERGSRKSKQ